MLNSRGAVHWPLVPQSGHTMSDIGIESGSSMPFFSASASWRWSWRRRLWQLRHSTSGSVKVPTWPEATHVSRGRMIEESRPTTSSRLVTIDFHHCRRMFSLSSTPRGP